MLRASLQRDRQAAATGRQGRALRSGKVGAPDAPERLSLAEATERLASPYAEERYSCLTGVPILVVDLDAPGSVPSDAQIDAARETLARLACPTVALCAEHPLPGNETRAVLHRRFDLVLQDIGELDAIAETTRRWPLASMALVQLLRHNEGLSVHEGLVAESLMYATLQGGSEFRAWLEAHRGREPRAHAEPAIRVGRVDDRLELTLNRPEKRNAFSVAMRDALVEALRVAVADDSIREVKVRGEGPAFSSGGDLDEFGEFPDPAVAHAVRSTRNPGRLLALLSDRLHFEVHGDCIGAGVELPAFAGRVTARADSSFQLPEVGLGLVPGAGGTVSLPRRIGRQRTAYLALSRTRLDLDTALAWGLVDERLE